MKSLFQFDKGASLQALAANTPCLMHSSTMTAKQFADNLVRDRSRILHGTWSTLNTRLGRSRDGMEGFVITVIRRAALELESYCQEPLRADDIDAFIEWLRQRATQTSEQNPS